MAERYDPNKRKRKEPKFFGLEAHKQLQSYKDERDKLKKPAEKKVSGFDLPGAQIAPTIPTPESVELDPIPRGGHPGAQHVVGSSVFDYIFGPKYSTDLGKGRPLPTPPLAKRPWDKIKPRPNKTNTPLNGIKKPRSKVLKDALRAALEGARMGAIKRT